MSCRIAIVNHQITLAVLSIIINLSLSFAPPPFSGATSLSDLRGKVALIADQSSIYKGLEIAALRKNLPPLPIELML